MNIQEVAEVTKRAHAALVRLGVSEPHREIALRELSQILIDTGLQAIGPVAPVVDIPTLRVAP
jgi:hypothetical protein